VRAAAGAALHISQCFLQIRALGGDMSWDRISGNWTQWKGRVQERWGKLTDDHLDVIAGRREQLCGRIQEIYGLTKDEVERQLRNWERNQTAGEFDEDDLVDEDEPPLQHLNGRKP
jgi:uncharacterized protein YjbJ (UPF0337 family)